MSTATMLVRPRPTHLGLSKPPRLAHRPPAASDRPRCLRAETRERQACLYSQKRRLHTSTRPTRSNFARQQRRDFHATSRLPATKNPYTVLGVNKGASAADIKKAYYGLAKKFHPDTNKDAGSKDKFAEAQSAYEILSDPQKKAAYDQFGAAAFDQGAGPSPGGSPFGGGNPFAGGGGFPGGGPFQGFGGGGFAGGINIDDLLNSFNMGGGGGRRGRRGGSSANVVYDVRGEDIEVSVNVSFMEAAKGTSKTINISPMEKCGTCAGKGLKAGATRSKCQSCGGSGQQVFQSGGFQVAATCGTCDGEGTSLPRGSECRTCRGDGVVRERKTVRVDIPSGVEDDMRLLLRGEGDAPATGQVPEGRVRATSGDLYVRVKVATDPRFGRMGADVLHTATIPLTTAILGGKTKIPTLDRDTMIKIPTGTNTGDKITLSGYGMSRPGARGHGNLVVEFKVGMPKYLSANQRTIVEMLAEEMGDTTATRIMNVGQAASDGPVADGSSPPDASSAGHKNEGFLKSVWHKITDSSSHKDRSDGPGKSEEVDPKPQDGESTKKKPNVQ